MIYYEDLSLPSEKRILERASKDAEHFTEEERSVLENICKALEKWEKLDEKENEILMSDDSRMELKVAKIQEEKRRLRGWVDWWELQGNQGMAFRENKKPFAFRVVGYTDHDGYSTPGIGVFEC